MTVCYRTLRMNSDTRYILTTQDMQDEKADLPLFYRAVKQIPQLFE